MSHQKSKLRETIQKIIKEELVSDEATLIISVDIGGEPGNGSVMNISDAVHAIMKSGIAHKYRRGDSGGQIRDEEGNLVGNWEIRE